MAKQQSFRHHYVPQWYQKGFLAEGQTSFKILDLHPPKYRSSDGATHYGRSVLDKGPDAWFFEADLYTTRHFGERNDDIERLLFGPIDLEGKVAIPAFRDEDWDTVASTYLNVFEFMDALRMRTPKGMLIWNIQGPMTQERVLHLMQVWRRMHCLMWAEGVLEIVRAPVGGPGFVFSDHPVTFFNPFVFPEDRQIPKGFDPPQAWMGTQTLFPLDKSHLFILTHLEWTRKQGAHRARQERTNARLFDNGMVRWDSCIRKRELTPYQVLEVNYIIKTRAHRYIAGRTVEDLYPERQLKTTLWSKIGRFLMPPENELFHFGGEIYVGYSDGRVHYQDEYGRRPRTAAEAEFRTDQARKMQEDLHRILKRDAKKMWPEGH